MICDCHTMINEKCWYRIWLIDDDDNGYALLCTLYKQLTSNGSLDIPHLTYLTIDILCMRAIATCCRLMLILSTDCRKCALRMKLSFLPFLPLSYYSEFPSKFFLSLHIAMPLWIGYGERVWVTSLLSFSVPFLPIVFSYKYFHLL